MKNTYFSPTSGSSYHPPVLWTNHIPNRINQVQAPLTLGVYHTRMMISQPRIKQILREFSISDEDLWNFPFLHVHKQIPTYDPKHSLFACNPNRQSGTWPAYDQCTRTLERITRHPHHINPLAYSHMNILPPNPTATDPMEGFHPIPKSHIPAHSFSKHGKHKGHSSCCR